MGCLEVNLVLPFEACGSCAIRSWALAINYTLCVIFVFILCLMLSYERVDPQRGWCLLKGSVFGMFRSHKNWWSWLRMSMRNMESRNQFCLRPFPMLLKSLGNPCKSLQSMRLCRISSSCKPLWPHSSWCYCRWSIDSKVKKDESLQVASLMYVHRKNVTAGIQREWIFSSNFFLLQTSRSQIPCLMGRAFRGRAMGVSFAGCGWTTSLWFCSRDLCRGIFSRCFVERHSSVGIQQNWR